MRAYHPHPRVPQGALVRLERSAVKVARCVLRGLGESDLAWLPGGGNQTPTGSTMDQPASEAVKNALEHVRHLRQVNLVLAALSIGVLILATTTREPWADRAVQELHGIRSFVQSQEFSAYGRFGGLWLKRRLLSEYSQLETGPKQGAVHSASGKEFDCFVFFHLGFQGSLLDPTTLNTANAKLVESVFVDSNPIETVAQWRALWNGLYASGRQVFWVREVMFERAEVLLVNHRPEYQRSALGTIGFESLLEVVRGARPRQDLAWVWGHCKGTLATIKTKFIFLRPSANHVRAEYTHAFWLLLFVNPDDQNPRFYEGKPWNEDGFYFLHIPVRVEKLNIDLQVLITREAMTDWQSGPFQLSFPGLERTLRNANDLPLEQAEIILRNVSDLESRSGRSLKFGGFELAGAPIFLATLLVLGATQMYFLIHLGYFLKRHGTEDFDFPWIALYPSAVARIIFLLTCIAPAFAGLVLALQFGGNLWIVAVGNVILSLAASDTFLKWSWPPYQTLCARAIQVGTRSLPPWSH